MVEKTTTKILCFEGAKLDSWLIKQMLLLMSREQLKWGNNWQGLTLG